MTKTTTAAIDQTLSSYRDVPQDEASKDLARLTTAIKRAANSRDKAEYTIGSTLNVIDSSGIAVAAAHSIDSKERDFSEDGRETAVSKYAAVALKDLDRRRYSEHRAFALRIDQLDEAGISTTTFKPSTFNKVTPDTTAADFTSVVAAMIDDPETKKVTAAAFTAAGREAGIVKPATAGGGGDPLQKALNAALVELKKATKLSKGQRTTLDAITKEAASL